MHLWLNFAYCTDMIWPDHRKHRHIRFEREVSEKMHLDLTGQNEVFSIIVAMMRALFWICSRMCEISQLKCETIGKSSCDQTTLSISCFSVKYKSD